MDPHSCSLILIIVLQFLKYIWTSFKDFFTFEIPVSFFQLHQALLKEMFYKVFKLDPDPH